MTEPTDQPAYRALHAATDGLLRTIVEHHRPWPITSSWEPTRIAYWECHGCDQGPHPEDLPGWPCSTIELIACHLGVPVTVRPDGTGA